MADLSKCGRCGCDEYAKELYIFDDYSPRGAFCQDCAEVIQKEKEKK